jgi:hypothetical protein
LLRVAFFTSSDTLLERVAGDDIGESMRSFGDSHFLQDMSKAIIDDVAKVLDAPGNNSNQ